jgi:hypothetical protein
LQTAHLKINHSKFAAWRRPRGLIAVRAQAGVMTQRSQPTEQPPSSCSFSDSLSVCRRNAAQPSSIRSFCVMLTSVSVRLNVDHTLSSARGDPRAGSFVFTSPKLAQQANWSAPAGGPPGFAWMPRLLGLLGALAERRALEAYVHPACPMFVSLSLSHLSNCLSVGLDFVTRSSPAKKTGTCVSKIPESRLLKE